MDKNAIKKYAVWARRELISRVSQRALFYGISEKDCGDPTAESINGRVLTESEKKQRQSLIAKIKKDGYQQAMEAAAYTWFNRFSALRFMEVNGYLPSHVRVFTDEDNAFKPQILAEAIHLELDGLDREKVYAMKDANRTDELYKYLLITQCNALGAVLPGMFTRIEDYTELLFPDNLLREGSVIEQMIALIPQEDWSDQVQIIGWLYEAYNTERNELVYDGNMSKSRITKDLLPAATTIFTPDWAVRYMVENSLGRLWVEGHPNEELKANWKYYLEEAEQEPDVQKQLAEIRKEYAALKPDDIRCIDPCMGSGHILVYMFDVLIQIYEAYGYNTREAAGLILQNNLYGLDIDDRASQLAYFAVMMKARQYDRRIFSRGIQPHVYAIVESNDINSNTIEYFVDGRADLKKALGTILTELHDAKEYGSILNVSPVSFPALYARFDEIREDFHIQQAETLKTLLPIVQVAEVMVQKYHTVATNPPYLSNSRYSPKLDGYVKQNYPDEKSDLSMVMLKRAIDSFSAENGFITFITTSSWMFLSSFEKLRTYLFEHKTIDSIVDYGTELFDGKVGHNPIVAWVNRNSKLSYKMTAIRLVDYCYAQRDRKEPEFFKKKNRFTARQDNFEKIPGSPVAYWASERLTNAFTNGKPIDIIGCSRSGMQTGNNDLFLRYWFEVQYSNINFNAMPNCDRKVLIGKWFPQPKGGEYRKWYGNFEYVVNFENNGRDLKNYTGTSIIKNPQFYFRRGVSWSHTTSKFFSGRYMPNGCIFNVEAPTFYPHDESWLEYVLGFVNTKILDRLFGLLSQTMHYMAGDMAKIPVILDLNKKNYVSEVSEKNTDIAKSDWDSFETSWDFKRHPLICGAKTVSEAYAKWESECEARFNQIKANEEELNRIFIDIYGLQDELTPEVEDKDVTVRKADLQRDIKSLISYAVGCMFGRYSLEKEGLIYAGGNFEDYYEVRGRTWDDLKNTTWDQLKDKTWKQVENRYYALKGSIKDTYPVDIDNIIPICDDEYFDDDIVGRFVDFVRVVYGEDTLEENLRFIAKALLPTASSLMPRQILRNYFLNDFYADHLKIYQKRPIYWLFDSGKKGGFKALIYMHRYQPDTIARIRTDYVHEQQARYRTAIADLENRIAGASTSERVKLNKQLQKLQAQATEIHDYEEKIHHLADQMIRIDLDDGVKHNYELFADVLTKIK